jgi:hypothetical protein
MKELVMKKLSPCKDTSLRESVDRKSLLQGVNKVFMVDLSN